MPCVYFLFLYHWPTFAASTGLFKHCHLFYVKAIGDNEMGVNGKDSYYLSDIYCILYRADTGVRGSILLF